MKPDKRVKFARGARPTRKKAKRPLPGLMSRVRTVEAQLWIRLCTS